MKINTHILGLLVVVGLFSLQSCDEKVTISKEATKIMYILM